MVDNAKLVAQLRTLILLTQTEQQVAETRVAQARTDAVRKELAQNAEHAGERTEALLSMLRRLGGVPDVVTPAVGRISGLAKTLIEQGAPMDEALLGDLSMEHQLLDRATYLKVLATTAENKGVVSLAERLVKAHTATVEWLTTVLAEEALGGPSALRATPVQRVAGGLSRAANTPSKYVAETVNKTVDSVTGSTKEARATVVGAAGRAVQVTGMVRDALAVGRDATLRRGEKLAKQDGDKETASEIHETLIDLGALEETELPIKKYDSLTISEVSTAVKKLTAAEDIRAIMRYEEAHKNRSGVVSATQAQLAGVAKTAAGIDA